MTIDEQLRGLANRVDQLQRVITAQEVADRVSKGGTQRLTDSRFDCDRMVVNHMPVQSPEEEATVIDLETPSRADEQRGGPKRYAIAALAAAAAVIAIALVAVRRDDTENPADRPAPTATVASTASPRALFGTPNEQFSPGTYFVDEVDGTAVPRILITVGEGWYNSIDRWGIFNAAGGFISFNLPDRVYSDSCHTSAGYQTEALTTLDGMVAALAHQRGWVDVTPPSDGSVDGYAGKVFQRTAPSAFSGCASVNSTAFRGWDCCGDSQDTTPEIYYRPNEVETVRVLDLNGTVIVVSAKLKPNSQGFAAELAAALASIRVERG